jgi:diguanylate cyclase (GGDEF)-like protein
MKFNRNSSPEDITDLELSRVVLQFTLVGFVGSAFLFLFSIYSLAMDRDALGLYLLLFATIGTLLTFYLRQTGDIKNAVLASSILICLLALYLVATGGVEQTGPLWVYSLFVLLLFLQGHRTGLIISLILLTLITLLLYAPLSALDVPDYPSGFKGRFLVSIFATLLIAWVLEYSRNLAFSTLQHYHRELEEVARTDYLTGVFNRRAMIEKLNAEISRFNRTGEVFSILLIDIDHFKQINDMYGHATGDFVIKAITQLMQDQLREHDAISRWGGEEFLILLPNTVREQAHYVGELLRKNIESRGLSTENNAAIELTVSVGISSAEKTSDALVLVDQADARLYQAKRGGRNQVVSSDPLQAVADQEPNDSVV